jgi:hypothetical protein
MKLDDHEKNSLPDSKELPKSSEATGDQNEWCRAIFQTLEPPRQLTDPDSVMSLDNEPTWVQNVFYHLMQQAAPSFSIDKTREITPKILGRYLGQQCANLYAVQHLIVEVSDDSLRARQAQLAVFEQNRNLPGVESLLKSIEFADQLVSLMPDYFPRFEAALHNSFQAALGQSDYKQAVQFFQGFAKGISKPGIVQNRLARNSTATQIYQRLIIHRGEVERLENYPALQEFLANKGMPKHLVGSLKRLQKLCERCGLLLAKRGRPPKS